jgi:hypothetical protein
MHYLATTLLVAAFLLTSIGPSAAQSGATWPSYDWVILLCKFADTATEPDPPSHFEAMMNPVDGIGHWWKTVTYGGTFTSQITGWLTLPQPKAHYTALSVDAMRQAMYTDCTAQAAPIELDQRDGVMIVSAEPMAPGFEGTEDRSDTIARGTVWLSPLEYDVPIRVIHYMGRSMGLRFSLIDTPDLLPNPWDGMSGSLALCAPQSSCYPPQPSAYTKMLGLWMPAINVAEHPSYMYSAAFYEIAYLDSAPGTLPLLVVVQSSATDSIYYFIEARRNIGGAYDHLLPASGVIIHRVQQQWGHEVWLVGANDVASALGSGPVWTPGETFVDWINGITISIKDETANGFRIVLYRGESGPIPSNTPSETPNWSSTETAVAALTATVTPSATPTLTYTDTPSAVPSDTPVATLTPTVTPSETPASTFTETPSLVPSNTPVSTSTTVPTATATAPPPPSPTLPVNFVINPSFEGFSPANVPWGWLYKGSDGSRVVCGVASEGVCSLRMRQQGKLHQFFDTSAFNAGDRLTFGAHVFNDSPEANVKLMLIIKYADPAFRKDMLTLIPTGYYQQFRYYSGGVVLLGKPTSVQLAIRTEGQPGRVFVDSAFVKIE